ncbi:MAG: helix-turn-helix transcriptional regulator [Lachnospiraceae bacterium]|nr:helix-turn-helix transcriptional regulator [Lachnospiraceae bacterium]
MDYYKIGQRIRKIRKACNLSQDQLAENAGISVTHMSHIETGNTKLSLPVLVEIAKTLQVSTDELLYDNPNSDKITIKQEISELIDTCTEKEAKILMEAIKSLKICLDKYS